MNVRLRPRRQSAIAPRARAALRDGLRLQQVLPPQHSQRRNLDDAVDTLRDFLRDDDGLGFFPFLLYAVGAAIAIIGAIKIGNSLVRNTTNAIDNLRGTGESVVKVALWGSLGWLALRAFKGKRTATKRKGKRARLRVVAA
jgi:hypothetical protein